MQKFCQGGGGGDKLGVWKKYGEEGLSQYHISINPPPPLNTRLKIKVYTGEREREKQNAKYLV